MGQARLCRPGQISARCTRSRSAIPLASGPNRPNASTGSSPSARSRTPPLRPAISRSNGSRTASSTSPTTASTGIWRPAATRPRSSGRATILPKSRHITYRQLHDEVCKFANILRTRNVAKGDRVTIYLPMIPEAAYAMLACARIGAVHSVVFAGFSPDSLAQRITDCQSKIIITADEGLRGGKKVPLKANVDAAIAKSGGVDWVVVVKRTGTPVAMDPVRDFWYHDAAEMVTTECPVRADERGRSAVHPLYVGLDRPAQGRAAHLRRLSGLRVDDASIRVRLSRRRYLLVHRRCRLGHRPQLHSLWAAGQRRHHADVRRRAELP